MISQTGVVRKSGRRVPGAKEQTSAAYILRVGEGVRVGGLMIISDWGLCLFVNTFSEGTFHGQLLAGFRV